MGGQHQYSRGRSGGLDLARRLDPTHLRHRDVHDHHAGRQVDCQLDRLHPAGSLAHHEQAWILTKEVPGPLAHDGMVVGQHNSNRLHHPLRGPGVKATTRQGSVTSTAQTRQSGSTGLGLAPAGTNGKLCLAPNS